MAFSILVCIKAVPDLASGDELTLADRWIDETAIGWCMNHYDAHALEAALAIKDATPDVTIDAISAGPDRVRDTIRRAMAMGADAGIHLAMETPGRLSPEAVAMAIADYARHKKPRPDSDRRRFRGSHAGGYRPPDRRRTRSALRRGSS
jgi:electron transfer flavoprotein beta subunit